MDDGVNLGAIIILYNLNMKDCRHWREIWVKKIFKIKKKNELKIF